MRWSRSFWVSLAGSLCLAAAAPAPTPPRLAEHDSFGRVVFALAPSGLYDARRDGDTLIVHMPGTGSVPAVPTRSKRVRALAGGTDSVTLSLVPGATTRLWRLGGLLVVDVFDPTPQAAALAAHVAAQARPTPAPRASSPKPDAGTTPPALPASAPPDTLLRLPLPFVAEPIPPILRPQHPAMTREAASATAAMPGGSPAGGDAVTLGNAPPGDLAFFVPAPKASAIAGYQTGREAVLVLDGRKTLDISALAQAAPGARAETLAQAVMLTLPVPEGAAMHVAASETGWTVTLDKAKSSCQPAGLRAHDGALDVALPASRVVAVPDHLTGGVILVATARAPICVREPLDAAEFSLIPSVAGAAFRPYSDRVTLVPAGEGLRLHAAEPGGRLALPDEAAVAAGAGTLSRRFDLPNLPVQDLRRRLEDATQSAARAPALARFAPLTAVSEAQLALGLGCEAAATAQLARSEAPDRAHDRDAAALSAMAAFACGTGDTGALDASEQQGTDEIALWQALAHPDRPGAADQLAATWRLIAAYPESLRRALTPRAAEMLAQSGAGALETLLKASGVDAPFARALAAERSGQTDAALSMLDHLASGTDRRDSARALREAVELRLAAGKLTPAQAADLLESRLYAWRDDAFERNTRRRIAALDEQAGQWRRGLEMLRESETLFPEQAETWRDAQRKLLADLLDRDRAASLPAVELVTLADEASDLLTGNDTGEKLAPLLVDRLLALDLPSRAETLIRRLMAQTRAPAPKAELGLRLASLRLDEHDPDGADGALSASASSDLPPDLAGRRAVLTARVLAARGRYNEAATAIAGLTSPEALDVQADIAEHRGDYATVVNSLRRLADLRVPAAGPLDDASQALLLRWGSAATRAHDPESLREVLARANRRLDPGRAAPLLAWLASPPVTTSTDLARSAQELSQLAAAARAGDPSKMSRN